MKTCQVSGILLICLYILQNQGYDAKSLRHHHGRHDHDKVPQQDYAATDDLHENYLTVAKLSGYIIKKYKKNSNSTIKKNVTAISTEDKMDYIFFPTSAGVLQFKVLAANDAHVALSCSAEERDPMYEVFIGGSSNTRSVIRKNRTEPHVAEVETRGILNGSEYKGFWVRWNNGTITAGNEGNSTPFLGYTDTEKLMIEYVGVRTALGASGSWIIEQGDVGHWVLIAHGSILPLGAYEGGVLKGKPMYVIRANGSGGLIPGSLGSGETSFKIYYDRSYRYYSTYYTDRDIDSYEVLCDFGGYWQHTSGNATIPTNAVVAGQTSDGELLYVGRVKHEGSLLIGKIQPSKELCVVKYERYDRSFSEYEILVS